MKHSYNVTGMTCESCKASVEKSLSNLEGVKNVDVDLENAEAKITMEKHISVDKLQKALAEKYQISEKKEEEVPTKVDFDTDDKSTVQQLFPLFLIFGYITVTAFLLNRNPFEIQNFMLDFMGLFYIVFSFFKFLDVKGFAMSFQMYDPLARNISC